MNNTVLVDDYLVSEQVDTFVLNIEAYSILWNPTVTQQQRGDLRRTIVVVCVSIIYLPTIMGFLL